MARNRPNWRAIKIHRSYTVEEAAIVLGVAKGTVRLWLKGGLPAITDKKPLLILGPDLKDYLETRRKPKQRCQLQEFFCFRCKVPRAAAGRLIDYVPKAAKSGHISAICEACETIMNKNVSAAGLPLLMRLAEVSFPRGQPSLTDITNPR
ncbi:helix-turn-helix domain-containing protein [Rhizobium sp. TH2]|uniref:helix-turn-helix domain-containing protein n=1 Tax=Rhizobium sp. TH2 TaxID=2775403 RepID=UPI0021573607|nr:helix-turn-helix domain-containing protein [Rhizobium sp. TH2]UVC09593.1 helix-turn-helix domain-containing protein [Rhizobium sp. TH2]